MKTARKKQYIMCHAPIYLLDDQLKAEFGMKAKMEKEDETINAFCSLKVAIDQEEKESKTYTVKVTRYDSGRSEEFLKWSLILTEQVKNNGYTENPDNIMNLVQSQEAKKRVRKSTTISENTPKQTSPYSSCQFERLTPKLDGETPTRGREST
jgi:hypothetical protein